MYLLCVPVFRHSTDKVLQRVCSECRNKSTPLSHVFLSKNKFWTGFNSRKFYNVDGLNSIASLQVNAECLEYCSQRATQWP